MRSPEIELELVNKNQKLLTAIWSMCGLFFLNTSRPRNWKDFYGRQMVRLEVISVRRSGRDAACHTIHLIIISSPFCFSPRRKMKCVTAAVVRYSGAQVFDGSYNVQKDDDVIIHQLLLVSFLLFPYDYSS